MSNLPVTIEQLTIHEHPNADALELAQVGLYRAIVGKGIYQTGDYALYIPEQAVLPARLIEELGLTGRLAGKEKNRVKAIRLRGELSQGIVCRPSAIATQQGLWDNRVFMAERDGVDWSPYLGITKWVPPIPVGMSGQVQSAPDLIRWIDIENIKRYPDIFEAGEQVVATEKIHGTACLYTYVPGTDPAASEPPELRREYVSSKGFGGKSLAIEPSDTNLYWRAVRTHGLATYAAMLSGYLRAQKVGLFGEVYGKGVQDLHYGKDAGSNETIGYALFDVAYVDQAGEQHWVNSAELDAVWAGFTAQLEPAARWDLPRVPTVYRGPYDYEALAALAEGKSELDPGTIREGLVIRPAMERHSEALGGRAIGKIVSESYLLRGGNATEFE